MTVEEARNTLEKYYKCISIDHCERMCCTGCENYIRRIEKRLAVKEAIEALDKQIPMKPQIIDCEQEKTHFFCPVCAYKLCGDDFCGDCGQAIDWSEEE